MAEGIARVFLQSDPSFGIKSAGLYAIPGTLPSEKAIDVCSNHGIHIETHRAQALTPALAEWADIILCMERGYCLHVRSLSPENTSIRLIGEGVPEIPDEIADPYGGDMSDYEQTFFHLTKAITFHFGHYKEGREYDRKAKAFG